VRTAAVIGCSAIAILAAGCGSGGSHAGLSTSTPATTASRVSEQARLENAVRLAVQQNFKLSLYVLWHNEIPAWASRSTGGPALAALRASAVTRRGRDIRIRPIKTSLRIQAIRIHASYATATAVADSKQRVRPYEAGKPQPKLIALHERARLTLKRVGSSDRFIVWKAVSIP
jgi:hypothetical protein